jgi:hypothetical protein
MMGKIIISFILSLITSDIIIAQANPDPCNFPNVTCTIGVRNGIVNSFGCKKIIYASPDRSMPFWLAVGDTSTSVVDTTTSILFILHQISGPGLLEGNPATLPSKYVYLNDISFTENGTYEIGITAGGGTGLIDTLIFIVPPESDFCSESPGGDCSTITGNEIFAVPAFSIITVDAVIPVKVGTIDSLTGFLDSTFIGTIYVEKLSGPGLLYGTLSMSGGSWFNFTNIRFSAEGLYQIRFYEEGLSNYKEAIVEIEVISPTSTGLILSSKLAVYPNPFSNQLTINVNSGLAGGAMTLYDYTGKKVLSQKIKSHTKEFKIDTHFLEAGIYLVNFYDTNSSIYYSSKIVKR